MRPSEEQRRLLCELIHEAFLMIRALGADGEAEKAGDLADAFHNLPVGMHHDNWDPDWFREDLERFERTHRCAGHLLERYEQIFD